MSLAAVPQRHLCLAAHQRQAGVAQLRPAAVVEHVNGGDEVQLVRGFLQTYDSQQQQQQDMLKRHLLLLT